MDVARVGSCHPDDEANRISPSKRHKQTWWTGESGDDTDDPI